MISHLANVGDAKTLVISSRQHHASADGRRPASRPQASARSWCGCRSASKPCPTSSTISARRFAHSQKV